MLGSTQDDEVDMASKDELRGDLTRQEAATVDGIAAEMEIVKEMMRHQTDVMLKMKGLIQTLQGQFTTFQDQRVRELTLRMNGGPTVKDGSIDQSRN